MSWIRRYINHTISRIKGEKFEIDENVPISYLFRILCNKCTCGIYGMLTLKTSHPIYRSRNTVIRCKSKLRFGKNISIARGCIIDGLSMNGIIIGDNVSFGLNTTMIASGSFKSIGKGIIIGNNVGLGTHGFFGGGGGLEIGNDTILGNFVSIHPENHNFKELSIPIRLQGVNHKGVRIGNDCWIGAKVTILDGSEIGDGSVVAAGAVVIGKFPPNCIIGGVPARIIKKRTDF